MSHKILTRAKARVDGLVNTNIKYYKDNSIFIKCDITTFHRIDVNMCILG